MKTFFAAALLIILSISSNAQNNSNDKKKGNFSETVKQLPDMLVAKADNGPDSSMYFLKNDNLQLTVQPAWQQNGTQVGNELKLQKVNDEPLDATFPIPDKKLANGLTVTLMNYKKPADDKKQQITAQVKSHLQALYKADGKQASSDEMNAQLGNMIKGPEKFTTSAGLEGEIYLVDDFQPQQSNFSVIFMAPGTKPGATIFIQFNYYHFMYDNALPDDMNDLKVFSFPDDQAAYVDFTKNILKTLRVN
ncbi:MAG TPA: hypothetical protein VG603_03715 [Chitinophagales bacterium]|nr:hypothetical protein [Chitinophagales bacterium]